MNIALAVDQITSVSRLHRHLDGVISFAVKSDDVFCPIYAVRAGDLETVFPEFREHLFKNSYVWINAAVRMAQAFYTRNGAHLNTTRVRFVTCAQVMSILIVILLGKSCEDVLRFAKELVSLHQVPPWSGVVYSGRGMWLLWLLNDAVQSRACSSRSISRQPPESPASLRARR